MIQLVSPEFSIELFCYRMFFNDPIFIMDAASAEITYAGRNHREESNGADFRKGSRGRIYCEDLRKLVAMLMNGQIPNDSDLRFMSAVTPLMNQLLIKWKIGNLRGHFK